MNAFLSNIILKSVADIVAEDDFTDEELFGDSGSDSEDDHVLDNSVDVLLSFIDNITVSC